MFISENNAHFNRLQTFSLYHVDRNVQKARELTKTKETVC